MSIYPITSERLKTVVIFGHSNADGWAGSSPLIDNHNELGSISGITTDADGDADAYWKNVYVFTSAKPFPSLSGVPTATDIGTGEWLEMTISNPSSPTAPHPHSSPYNYPNVRGSCVPNWYWNSDPVRSGGGTLVGVEVPLQHFWKMYWQEQVGFVKVAQSSSVLMPSETGGSTAWIDIDLTAFGIPTPDYRVDTNNYNYYAWWTPTEVWDFAPSTDRFYKKWYDKMVGAAAALPEGKKIDVRLIIPWMGDNDAAYGSDVVNNGWENTVRAFIKRVRKDIDDNDWSAIPAHQIPIVWPKINLYYGSDNAAVQNSILDSIATDDPYFKTVEVQDLTSLTDEGYNPLIVNGIDHYGGQGYYDAALRIMSAFEDTQDVPFDTLAEEDRITASDAMTRIRRYYGRSRTTTDLEDDGIVIQHMNAAIQHICNQAGDNAWWLELRVSVGVSGSPASMPKYVRRVTRVEDPRDPTNPLKFEQTGFGDGGKVQIVLKELGTGTYNMTVIIRPKEITRTDELVPLPYEYVEWMVVEACRRLARSAGNMALQASFEGEARTLQVDTMRNMGAQNRGRKDAISPQRRRVNLSYNRQPRQWDQS